MSRLRALVWSVGLLAAMVDCGPLSSRDKSGRASADAVGGEYSSGGAGAHLGGSETNNAGDDARGGADSELGGASSSLSGAAGESGGAAGMNGEAGAGGEPEPEPVGPYTIASGQLEPTGIAVSEKYVYWANREAGTIVRCPRFGCGDDEPTVLAPDAGAPRGLTIDATHVYWIDEGELIENVRNVSLYKCPLSGCLAEPTLVTDWATGNASNGLLDVHAVGETLYVAAWPMLGTCPIEGCDAPASIAAGPYVAVDTDGSYFYGSCLGWSQVVRCPLAGCGEGNADQLKVATVAGRALTVDGSAVYFSSGGQIVKCPLAGCGEDAPEVVLPDAGNRVDGLTSNATRLYFTNAVQGTVVSIPK
jgi:hypothetical protein